MTWPFNPQVPRNTWTDIEASGFPHPVPGCVYDGTRLDGGVPLGGLGTGYMTLEGSGKIGRHSIYNDLVPPKEYFKDWLYLRMGNTALPLSSAQIAYWGHYPVADLIAEFAEAPLTLALRAFTPFIVGSASDSNIPAALFEIELRNRGAGPLDVTLEIVPPPAEGKDPIQTELLIDGIAAPSEGGKVRGKIELRLGAGESRRVRLVFAWYAPSWRDSGNEPHVHRYGARYTSAEQAAADAWDGFDALLGRTLAWQRVVYEADQPAWLRDALVQGFYSLAKNTMWITRTRHDEWWGKDGWLVHNESYTSCPISETMVCRFHGHFPALFFFPELERTALEAFRHFQISDGEVPFSFGLKTSLTDPNYHCQHPLNSGQYAQMVYRLFLRTGDRALLERFYDSARRAIRYQYSLDDDEDGLVNEQAHVRPGDLWPANQFYDCWPWYGTSAYVAGTWLATLASGRAMAQAMGDAGFAAECGERLVRGRQAYRQKLWTGEYYRLWNDPANGRQSDVSLGNQLMGEWCTGVAGLPGVLPEADVQRALAAIEKLNMGATAYGLVNGVTPAGERFDSGTIGDLNWGMNTFVGESLCAAMTFIYHGQRETGLEIARRMMEAIILKSRSPWNQRCAISADTGLPYWGEDYYSDMIIWSLPMALAGQGVAEFVAPGGLVERMIAAGAAV